MSSRIKIKFTGFWPGWNPEDNFIINALKTFTEVELSDEPEYLFSSWFSNEYRDYDCVKIFYTGENVCPDFNVFDYGIGFECMDYGDRYLRYPLYYVSELYGHDYDLMLTKHENAMETLKEKSDFCSFVVSNGTSSAEDLRRVFFEKLSKYKQVNSGGRYLNNIGEPNGVADKLAFQTRHKFAIAFENSAHDGYVTEKLVQAFAAKTIPIYWGSPTVSSEFNPKAFINCQDYPNLDAVIEQIKKIDEDDELCLSILSEPALLDDKRSEYDARLVDFLKNVVSQGTNPMTNQPAAYRYNRLRFDRAYLDREKRKDELLPYLDDKLVNFAYKFEKKRLGR